MAMPSRIAKGRPKNLGRREEALDSLEQSLAFDSENGYAHNLKGLMLVELGRFEEAREWMVAAALTPVVADLAERVAQRDTLIVLARETVLSLEGAGEDA